MISGISSTFFPLESSVESLWKALKSSSIRIGFFLSKPRVSFAVAVAVGLRRRLRASLKGSPCSSLPAATLAFASHRRKSSSVVRPSFAVAAAAPAVRRRRSSRRRRSGRPPSWSLSRRRPRPPLRRRRRPPEHRRRRQPEEPRRFLLVAGAVRCLFAVVLVAGEFAVPPAPSRCPPFASSCRRSPASMRRPSRLLRRAAAAVGDVIAGVIKPLSREPVVDR